MPLAETVTIEVGTAISKAVLRLWLREHSFAADLSSSLADILRTTTTDMLSLQRGRRLFEEIGERVGESMVAFFEAEGVSIDESGKVAVALAVGQCINRSAVTAALLASQELDPNKLANHILQSNPAAARDFTEAEGQLFRRTISTASTYIVQIASQIPSFTEQTFSEVLRRQTQILDRVNDAVDELQRIASRLAPGRASAQFELEYLAATVRKFDVLQLYGAPVTPASNRHNLSVAYVTLCAECQSKSLEQLSPRSPGVTQHELLASNHSTQERAGESRVVSVDELLKTSRCLLIRGPAGSGKTTLLQWVAVRAASRSFPSQLGEWNTITPFYVRLRECADRTLPLPEHLPALVAPLISETMPQRWVHDELKTGRGVILVDGLDEVSVSRRAEVRHWLSEYVHTFPSARFIVTTRPHAVVDGWMDAEGFLDAELQPMGIADIRIFIDQWHAAVKQGLDSAEEIAELEAMARKLKTEIETNRTIRNLATTPLLCAMLCALNRDRRRHMPTDRIELYEACTELLIDLRDATRHVDLSDYPVLSYRQKRLLLQEFAYWLIRNGWSEVDIEAADDYFASKLPRLPEAPRSATGSGVRKLFIERTGILRSPATGRIDFTHRTFQEYFAAQAVLDEPDVASLIRNAPDEQWREVTVLAVGRASTATREQTIRDLIARGDSEPANRYQLHLLAVSCLETSVELSPELAIEIEDRLKKLIPPSNMTDAKALAAAGDMAAQHLSQRTGKQRYKAVQSAACVRALSLISTDTALSVLETYAEDTRATVVNELLRAWEYFDRTQFAKRILARTLANMRELRLTRGNSLEGMEYLDNLKQLALLWLPDVRDLEPIRGLRNLETLEIHYCGVHDLSPLTELTALQEFRIADCPVLESLGPLTSLKSLQRLSITSCRLITDIRPIECLQQLTEATFASLKLEEISPLAALKGLCALLLWECESLVDISPLSELASLQTLSLSACAKVSEFRPLSRLGNLDELHVASCNGLTDLDFATGLTKLKHLNVASCTNLNNIDGIRPLSNLARVDLAGCTQLTSIEPLSALDQLRALNLEGCSAIHDFTSLSQLSRLEALNLADCPGIRDVSVLENLPHLAWLEISGCENAESISPLASIETLKFVRLAELADDLSLRPLGECAALQLVGVTRDTPSDLLPANFQGPYRWYELLSHFKEVSMQRGSIRHWHSDPVLHSSGWIDTDWYVRK